MSLSTEHAELIANLSLPVPNNIVAQVSFFGVPNINKSYSEVKLDTESIGSSDIFNNNFPLVPDNALFDVFFIFSISSVVVSIFNTCSNVNSELKYWHNELVEAISLCTSWLLCREQEIVVY